VFRGRYGKIVSRKCLTFPRIQSSWENIWLENPIFSREQSKSNQIASYYVKRKIGSKYSNYEPWNW